MKKIQFLICAMCVVTLNAYATTFWANNTQYDTTTCSGDDVILPSTNPTPPTGYQFAGWAPAYHLSTLDPSISASESYSKVATGLCYYRTNSVNDPVDCSGANYSDLERGEWKVPFSYGTIIGDTLCSTTSDANETPVATNGQFCWCRVTGFIPAGAGFLYTASVSTWGAPDRFNSFDSCRGSCANSCGNRMTYNSSVRGTLYGTN